MTNPIQRAADLYTQAENIIDSNDFFSSTTKKKRFDFAHWLLGETDLDFLLNKNTSEATDTLIAAEKSAMTEVNSDLVDEVESIFKIIFSSFSQFIERDPRAIKISKTYFDNDADGNDHFHIKLSFKSDVGEFSLVVEMVERIYSGEGIEWSLASGLSSTPKIFTLNGLDSPLNEAKERALSLLESTIESVCINSIETDVESNKDKLEYAEDIIAKYAPVIAMIKSIN